MAPFAPVFSVAAASYPVTQTVTITDATPNARIYYTSDGSAPSSSSTPYTGAVQVSASETLQAIAYGPGGEISDLVKAAYIIVPPVVSGQAFTFPNNIVGNTLNAAVLTITNSASTAAPLSASVSGDTSFSVAGGQGCGTQLAGNSSCTISVNYDPTAAGQQQAQLVVAIPGDPVAVPSLALSGSAVVFKPGVVIPTINPQVAQYSLQVPYDGTLTVKFGPDTGYGFTTSTQTVAAGTTASVLVAGMKALSSYHMRATLQFSNGLTVNDVDQTFTTGALPAGIVPKIQLTTTTGLTPQPGIELIDTIGGATLSALLATDLQGNVIWTYPFPDRQPTTIVYPAKLMPNGNIVMLISPESQTALAGAPAGTLLELREIDLAGNVVQQLSMADLNTRMTAAGFHIPLQFYSHDVTLLPNGHLLVIANTIQPFTDLPGYPGVTNVLGDVVVDLDQTMTPVWVWNAFDHLDVNRHPFMFPDWTHANAVVYSPDDGNFLISLRHQNWILKVNYANGTGDGSVIWKLGYQGDFTLAGGMDPTDWFYAQHNPSFFSTNTTGSFSLGIMDNGDDRVFPDGTNCDIQGGALCYTTIPVMQVDEKAMTATLTSHQILPASLYSLFAGNVELLANGDIEYNLAGAAANAITYEVTPGSNPQTVWRMLLSGTNTYREFRIPSLYPGVQW